LFTRKKPHEFFKITNEIYAKDDAEAHLKWQNRDNGLATLNLEETKPG